MLPLITNMNKADLDSWERLSPFCWTAEGWALDLALPCQEKEKSHSLYLVHHLVLGVPSLFRTPRILLCSVCSPQACSSFLYFRLHRGWARALHLQHKVGSVLLYHPITHTACGVDRGHVGLMHCKELDLVNSFFSPVVSKRVPL